MRQVERISVFLNLIDGRIGEILSNVWNIYEHIDDPDDTIDVIYDRLSEIEQFWKENPNLRFSQVLINLGIIPNTPGVWYYIEDEEILESLGLPLESFLIWGNRYDKDMNLLPEIRYNVIQNLESDHIRAILDGNWTKHPDYIKAFKQTLSNRGIDYDNS